MTSLFYPVLIAAVGVLFVGTLVMVLRRYIVNFCSDEGYLTFSLPIPRKTLYRLMLPHLHQIRQFAALRVELDGIKAQAKAGADRDTLQAKVNALDFEIPEYNCIIGLWGQPEARIGYSLISDFCKKHGLTTPPVSGATRHACKRRLVDFFRVCQRDADQPVWVDHRSYEGGLPFGGEPGIGLMDELVAEGVLVRREDGFCCLADWCHYRFDFSI
jgi:hypothetical protein